MRRGNRVQGESNEGLAMTGGTVQETRRNKDILTVAM